jgi:hypothetical protein
MGGRLRPYLTTVIDYGLPGKGQAQPEAIHLTRGREGLEEPVANFGSDPWPGIANLE